MPKPFVQWTVLPHGKLSRVDDTLLTVVGDLHMPLGDYPRRMTVARLRDARLVIYNAIALDEVEMHTLESFGEPAYLVVPNDLHRLDAKVWKDRYPAMAVVAPAGVVGKVEEVVHVDEISVELGDPHVRLGTVPGTDDREIAMEVTSPEGATLVVNDLIWNLDNRPGFGGWLMKTLGFTGDAPKIPAVVERREVKDKIALRDQLLRWSRLPSLQRIIVSHGAIITDDPAGALTRLAASLDA